MALPAPQQASTQAAIEQPAVVEHSQNGRLGVTGHGDRMEACLLRPSPVHPLEQGVGQVYGIIAQVVSGRTDTVAVYPGDALCQANACMDG